MNEKASAEIDKLLCDHPVTLSLIESLIRPFAWVDDNMLGIIAEGLHADEHIALYGHISPNHALAIASARALLKKHQYKVIAQG